ncbi:MAG: hypothetical protein ACREC6_00235, partial [Hyphomicrobiaceae bacterium]
MTLESLPRILKATGYLPDGQPAPGVLLGAAARRARKGRCFTPDASWRSPSGLTVYFKFSKQLPTDDRVATWRREIWNEGFAPLLWVVSPDTIDIYNGFGQPLGSGDADAYRIKTFENIASALAELDSFAGRVAME